MFRHTNLHLHIWTHSLQVIPKNTCTQHALMCIYPVMLIQVFKSLPPSLGEYYRQCFAKNGDLEWIVYQNERYTYRQAQQEYLALAAELARGFEVSAGDRVGICMRNYPEFLLAFFGVTAMGAVAVPLNALWKGEELEYTAKDAGLKVTN